MNTENTLELPDEFHFYALEHVKDESPTLFSYAFRSPVDSLFLAQFNEPASLFESADRHLRERECEDKFAEDLDRLTVGDTWNTTLELVRLSRGSHEIPLGTSLYQTDEPNVIELRGRDCTVMFYHIPVRLIARLD